MDGRAGGADDLDRLDVTEQRQEALGHCAVNGSLSGYATVDEQEGLVVAPTDDAPQTDFGPRTTGNLETDEIGNVDIQQLIQFSSPGFGDHLSGDEGYRSRSLVRLGQGQGGTRGHPELVEFLEAEIIDAARFLPNRRNRQQQRQD